MASCFPFTPTVKRVTEQGNKRLTPALFSSSIFSLPVLDLIYFNKIILPGNKGLFKKELLNLE